MASHQVLEGLGKELLPLSIVWSQISAPAFFVTNSTQLKTWIAELFETEVSGQYFYDHSLVEGFYHYFAAEMLRQLQKLHFAAPLIPNVAPPVEDLRQALGEESCFVIDATLSINNRHVFGRILLPVSFRTQWKNFFAHLPLPPLTEADKEKLPVDINLEVARSRLSLEEWREVKTGDLVVLDYCSYDPIEHKGGVLLTLNEKPILRGRIKEGEIKITNYPLYEQVDEPMDREEDENLYGDLDEDEDSEYEEEDEEDEDGDEDEEEEDEEDLFADLEQSSPPSPKESVKKKRAESISEEGRPISLVAEELPVHLTIEVGRLRMSAAELMKLAPGNLLDLHVTPEQGVDLVINGKKVGRGELVRIGDLLGVRILSM